MTPLLRFVANVGELRECVAAFNSSTKTNRDRSLNMLRQTSYWVFDENTQSFGPSKFVGFSKMTFEEYESAVKGDWSGDRFDGHATRTVIEHITGVPFANNPSLAHELIRWGEQLFGAGALNGVDESKWCFLTI
jgi:hypothetical protein